MRVNRGLPGHLPSPSWRDDCHGLGMTLETAIGRWLACAIHPQAAWRVMRPRGRAFLVGTYFGAAYVAALTALLAAAG
jgi:hypothetical protein